MSLSLFLIVSGLVFTILFSIIIKNIYDVFSINKITEFLNPIEDTVFNRIGISILPIIIWGFVEILALGSFKYFVLGIVLNIIVNCCISYIIIYGHTYITEYESKLFLIVVIIISSITGYAVNYLTLLIGGIGNFTYSVIGLLLLTVFYILIKLKKPNILIFKKQKK